MRLAVVPLVVLLTATVAFAEVAQEKPTIEPLVRAVDLNVGQEQTVELCDGTKATVKLLDLEEHRDALRNAVRKADVTVEVNGEKAVLTSATYHLPRRCRRRADRLPGHQGPRPDRAEPLGAWTPTPGCGCGRRARRGSGPARSAIPSAQRWFASHTLMANQIGDGEEPGEEADLLSLGAGLRRGGADGRRAGRDRRRGRRRPARSCSAGPLSRHAQARATTSSTSATAAAGTTATATWTRSTRP